MVFSLHWQIACHWQCCDYMTVFCLSVIIKRCESRRSLCHRCFVRCDHRGLRKRHSLTTYRLNEPFPRAGVVRKVSIAEVAKEEHALPCTKEGAGSLRIRTARREPLRVVMREVLVRRLQRVESRSSRRRQEPVSGLCG